MVAEATATVHRPRRECPLCNTFSVSSTHYSQYHGFNWAENVRTETSKDGDKRWPVHHCRLCGIGPIRWHDRFMIHVMEVHPSTVSNLRLAETESDTKDELLEEAAEQMASVTIRLEEVQTLLDSVDPEAQARYERAHRFLIGLRDLVREYFAEV